MTGSQPEPKTGRLFIAGLVASVAALVLFAWLATQVATGATIAFDASIRASVHRLASPGLTTFMRIMSDIGEPASLAILGIGALIALLEMHSRKAALFFVITMLGAFVLDATLKLGFGRPRPPTFFGTPAPYSYSFPSGHALFSACYFGVLAAFFTARIRSRIARIAIWFAACSLIFLIGLSRIYLGVHYPSDVIAGYAAAVVWVSAVAYADRLLQRHAANRAVRKRM